MSKKKKSKLMSAVALRYDSARDESPRVTAKGKGLVAEKIIEKAKINDIPVRQDIDLVEVLSQVDIGQEIPASTYKIVAELLAFVYQVNRDYAKNK
tara:strand:+ start:644 stop:931 length:288 start_codon:yes stop_codon:yes gene_type:complete